MSVLHVHMETVLYIYSGIEMYRHCGNAELEIVIIIINNNDNIQ